MRANLGMQIISNNQGHSTLKLNDKNWANIMRNTHAKNALIGRNDLIALLNGSINF